MTKLQRTVEQTVRKYEDNAFGAEIGRCYFCLALPGGAGCSKCPIHKIEPNNIGCYAKEILETRHNAIGGDVVSCLALMLYFWGFLPKGER